MWFSLSVSLPVVPFCVCLYVWIACIPVSPCIFLSCHVSFHVSVCLRVSLSVSRCLSSLLISLYLFYVPVSICEAYLCVYVCECTSLCLSMSQGVYSLGVWISMWLLLWVICMFVWILLIWISFPDRDPTWTQSVPKIKDGKARDFPADLSDWYSLKWLGQPIGILPLLHHFPYPSEQWNHRACGGGGGIWSVSLSALPWTHSIRHTSSGLVSNSHEKTENSQHWR